MDPMDTKTTRTAREREAVRAYLRLLGAVRAAFDASGGRGPLLVPPGVLAEAEAALGSVGMAGNEAEFFALLTGYTSAGGRSGTAG